MAWIARVLDRADIPYMLIGGLAVPFYGRVRFTDDIDVELGVGPDRFDDVARIGRELKLKPIDMGMTPKQFAQAAMLYPCMHRPTGLQVDLAFAFFEFEQDFVKHARRRQIAGYPVRVARAEELLILKAIAGRDVDLGDIRAIYARNRDKLDMAYVRKWVGMYSDMVAIPHLQRFNELIADMDRRLDQLPDQPQR